MNEPSQRAKHGRSLLTAAAVALVVAGVVTVAVTTSQSVRVPVVVGAMVTFGFVFLIVSIVKLSKAAAAKRSAEVTEACAPFGLVFHRFAKGDDKDAAFEPFTHLKQQLRTGGKGLEWIAQSPTGEPPLTLLQHHYVVSTGQTTVRVSHTLAALPCPESWPDLSLTPEHFGHRIAGVFGKGDMQLESAEFNKRWFVKADDEDFAALMLTPEMQAWLLDAPKWASLRVGQGQLICYAKKSFKPEELPVLVGFSRGFSDRIAPELQAWIPRA